MYLSHFGLNEAPFRITPRTDFFFDGANRGATLEALVYAITHDEGIVKVSGEVGSGKTMLCRVLMERLPKNVEIIYLFNPSLSREDILLAIADELKVNISANRTAVVLRALQEHLITVYAEGHQVVVLIDEAHAMPLETLEEIRLLSNLESSRHKLLQIVLFGQPELDENLNIPQMRQLKERITHNFRLQPMIRDDIAQYLIFRMRAAGYRGPDIFSQGAIRAIARASLGLTRRINILANKSLLAAFSQNTHQITVKHVRAAIRDSEFRPAGWRAGMFWIVAGGVAAGIAIGFGLRFIEPAAPTAPASETRSPISAPGTPPAPDTVSAGVAPKAAGPLTRARMIATETWLADRGESGFAIQVMAVVAGNERELEAFLDRADKLTGLDKVYVYEARIKGQSKNGLAVVYGRFASREKVGEAIAGFPAEIRMHRPYLRTVEGIRREILERNRTA
jgi:type II secretory pathway predicted ATPase ExeA